LKIISGATSIRVCGCKHKARPIFQRETN